MMKLTGFMITDWIFFFHENEKKSLNDLLSNKKKSGLIEEFITWKLITAYLPAFTFILAFFFNFITNKYNYPNFYTFFNNGSLPIISFGIITAGMPYLMEQLKDFPEFHLIRRRVMAIALVFLFLTATLYILQTLNVLSKTYDEFTNIAITTLSILGFIFSLSIGYKMFLLQSTTIEDYATMIQKETNNLSNSLDDLQ